MDKTSIGKTFEIYRKLIPCVDFQRTWHLLPVVDPETRKPKPTENSEPDKKDFDWSEFFANDNPVEVEIGSGKGNFVVEYSQKNPDINIIGIEIETKYSKYTGRRLQLNEITNGAALHGDAFYFLRDYLKDETISSFHMYFPDPWPKDRHRKRRLLKPEFLEEVYRTAKSGGNTKFYWGTDFQEYHESALELFAETPFLEIETLEAEPTAGIMTNFEKKYRKEGRPIYRSVVKVLK